MQNGSEAINLCANNYLGLSGDPDVIEAARDALMEHGFGMSSVRFICGTQDVHSELESRLSEFLGTEDTILYSSCFDANTGLFETILGPEDAVISDALNHASIIDGERGRGTPELAGQMERVDIVTGTLGKALGGASGGYTSGRKEIIELLRQRSRPYLFSNTLAPVIAATSLSVLDTLEASGDLRAKLEENSQRFRAGMTSAEFDLVPGDHPIIPVMLGDAGVASEMADRLLGEGIYVVGFSYPVVPMGKARIRTQLSAAHTFDQIDLAIDAFIRVGRDMKVIA